MAGSVIRFPADRRAYLRSHAWLAAIAMGGTMLVLWLIGNPYVWTGAPAGLAAIALRGWYLASEELATVWEIRGGALISGDRRVALSDIQAVNTLGSFVQIVTRGGDKHLIKYQSNPAATKAEIERALP